MLIEFVNHASLIVKSGNVRLIADPWLEGKSFMTVGTWRQGRR